PGPGATGGASRPYLTGTALAGPALLDRGERPVDEENEGQQEERERDRHVEVPLAGLEHHRGRERTRLPLDVATDHHRRADLGDDATEPRHDGGEHRQPRLAEHHPDHLEARGAERQELEAELPWHLL